MSDILVEKTLIEGAIDELDYHECFLTTNEEMQEYVVGLVDKLSEALNE